MLKTLAWALLTVLPFFLPNGAIAAYGESRHAPAARVLASPLRV